MIALAFSGGKDSWVCLHLYKDKLDEIIVLWVNTGKNYPEALESINKAKVLCKNFIEIKTERNWQNYINGLPSDIVPIANTVLGESITGSVETKVQSYLNCCMDNISAPLMAKVKELGITLLISGKRLSEGHQSSHMDGDVIDGVMHVHPIENWTDKEVLDLLHENMVVPKHFSFSHSSLDCYDCTAYRKDTKDLDAWSAINHPALFAKKTIRLDKLKEVLKQRMSEL